MSLRAPTPPPGRHPSLPTTDHGPETLSALRVPKSRQGGRPAPPARPPFPKSEFYAGLALFAALTLLFWLTDLDRAAARAFFDCVPPWPGRAWAWSEALYRWGPWPADLAGALGWAAFAASFADARLRRWRGPGLYLGLLLLLGPGLLSNLLAKGLAGRPRPVETLGFGGMWEFHRPFELGVPGRGQSFLSGHASCAWYFLGLVFLAPPRRRGPVLGAGLAFGLAMGLARVSQGAHWPSDVLLPGAMLWTLAAALSPLIHWQPPARLVGGADFLCALALAGLGALSLAHVAYEERHYSGPAAAAAEGPTWRALPGDPDLKAVREVDVDLLMQFGGLTVSFDAAPPAAAGPGAWPLTLDETFEGQGLPPARDGFGAEFLPAGGQFRPGPGALSVRFEQAARGLWLVADERVRLGLPAALGVAARLRVADGTITIGPFPAGRRVLLSGLPSGTRPPDGFEPFGGRDWLRAGAPPLVSLDLDGTPAAFEPDPPTAPTRP